MTKSLSDRFHSLNPKLWSDNPQFYEFSATSELYVSASGTVRCGLFCFALLDQRETWQQVAAAKYTPSPSSELTVMGVVGRRWIARLLCFCGDTRSRLQRDAGDILAIVTLHSVDTVCSRPTVQHLESFQNKRI